MVGQLNNDRILRIRQGKAWVHNASFPWRFQGFLIIRFAKSIFMFSSVQAQKHYAAHRRTELADDPAAAEAVDREHRRIDGERMRLKMGLTVVEDVRLELLGNERIRACIS